MPIIFDLHNFVRLEIFLVSDTWVLLVHPTGRQLNIKTPRPKWLARRLFKGAGFRKHTFEREIKFGVW